MKRFAALLLVFAAGCSGFAEPTQEHAAALIEIAKIAGHRFDDLVAGANPIHSARSRRMGVE